MNHIAIQFQTINDEQFQIITTLLQDYITGSEEEDRKYTIYIEEANWNEESQAILQAITKDYTTQIIAEQNWNATWESNFDPVVIDDFVYIKADFHPEQLGFEHNIHITPKMSFGTGHHATTAQVIQAMKHYDFTDKKVFDFGTGTGILAILAEKLGAASILAIDNDPWSVNNTIENIEKNQCSRINVQEAIMENVVEDNFDIIIANINRHILLAYMHDMSTKLNMGGLIIMSGILIDDVEIIKNAAKEHHLSFESLTEKNNWVCMQFIKQ